ncbi:response regulator [Candidatus Kaiserbacteria bacterium]|nr:response regulator [Candidatus Kaiserbacteria bacterium]
MTGITFSTNKMRFLPALRTLLPRKQDILPSLLVILFFISSARLTLSLLPPMNIAPALIWSPLGISLAFTFLFGYRMALPIMLATFLHLLTRGTPLAGIIAGVITNAAFPLLGTYIMRRFSYASQMNRTRDAYTILIVGSIVTMMFPATLFSIQWITGTLPTEDFITRFIRIWSAAVFSVVILTPLITSWFADMSVRLRTRQLAEAGLALAGIVAAAVLVFLTPYAQVLGGLVFLVILLPFLWISLRFETKYTALALFLMSAISVVGVALNMSGSPSPIGQRLYTVELFMVFLAFIFYILSSLVEERRRSALGLEQHVQQLEKALGQIKMQDKAKSEFLAVLAHELRNPLAPIVSALELLQLKGVWKSDAETFELIDDRVKTMRRLLDDLLDIARISQNKLRLQKTPTDVYAIGKQSIQSIQNQLERKQQRVEFMGPHETLLLDADPIRIEQVIRNLLSNASKFSEKSSAISIAITRVGDMAEIRVNDTGIGIDPLMLEKVFEPFLQIEQGHRNKEGIGIGLSITKRIVEMHGGSIEAKSEGTRRGSEFIVRLPLDVATMESQLIPNTSPERSPAPECTSILVVDDNKSAAHSLGKLLELTGHAVSYAYTGEEALRTISLTTPRFMVLDIGLPDMSGYEVAKQIRERGFRGTVIALTGYGQKEDKMRSLEAGCDHHMVKPIGIKELQAMLVTV